MPRSSNATCTGASNNSGATWWGKWQGWPCPWCPREIWWRPAPRWRRRSRRSALCPTPPQNRKGGRRRPTLLRSPPWLAKYEAKQNILPNVKTKTKSEKFSPICSPSQTLVWKATSALTSRPPPRGGGCRIRSNHLQLNACINTRNQLLGRRKWRQSRQWRGCQQGQRAPWEYQSKPNHVAPTCSRQWWCPVLSNSRWGEAWSWHGPRCSCETNITML